jgi:hypothetical protein
MSAGERKGSTAPPETAEFSHIVPFFRPHVITPQAVAEKQLSLFEYDWNSNLLGQTPGESLKAFATESHKSS